MLLNLSPVFLFVFIYCVNAYVKSDTESDEDDKLKQALVLVDILKKEYLKLLQSQYVMQQQLQQQSQPQQLQQQSQQEQWHVGSATTTEVLPTVNETTPDAEPEHHTARYMRRMGSGHEIPGLLSGRRSNKVPIDKVWNKKFLANYRRALSEPVNGTTINSNVTDKGNDDANMVINKTETTTIKETPRTTTEKRIHKATVNAIKKVTKAVTNKTKKNNSVKNLKSPASKNKPILRNSTDDKPEDNSTKEQNSPEAKPEDNAIKEHSSTEIKPEDNVTKDPVMDQIASELVNELKEDGVNKEDKNKQRQPPIIKNRVLDIKPTLRIHLPRSTKLPIPLPENNAFCYYVPRTPLCINGS